MSSQAVCVELAEPITHPSSEAVRVDIQCKIEISWNFYWSLWGNQAVAAANVIGFGRGEERKETIERNSKNNETDLNERISLQAS